VLKTLELGLLSEMERFCAFANIVNVLRVHAAIEAGLPQTSARWLAWTRAIHYHVGSLGVVSSFNLEHQYDPKM
jgi:hypothetical protein